jgi:hypothetical protein
MSHTPGPWEAEHEQCDPKPFPDDPGFFTINAPILNRHGPIADTMNRDHCISPNEDRANATLIAAAPDLLECLQWLDRKGGLGLDVHDEISRVIEKATR